MKLLIKEVKDGSFTKDEGGNMPYYWIKAVKPDGFIVRFGSTTEHEEGEEVEVDLEERTFSNGKKGYVEA